MSPQATAAAFLAGRFPQLGPGETIEVRALDTDGRPGPRAWFAEPHRAAAYAMRLAAGWHVYYGVCPRRRGGGKKAAVTSVAALWADVDDKRFPDGRAGALAALAGFPLSPTWLVDSGGGLQAYWSLDRPLLIAGDPTAVARVEGLLQRLYARLGGLDRVQDVSRVLRLPGTHNRKYSPPRPVVVLERQAERQYTLEQFEVLLPPSPPAAPPCPPLPGRLYRPPGRRGAPSLDELRTMLRHIPPRGDYREDWLRVLMAVHSVCPGPAGVALCEEWSPGTPGEVARKFASFRREGAGAVTLGTLIHLARRHGWRPPPRLPSLRGVRYV